MVLQSAQLVNGKRPAIASHPCLCVQGRPGRRQLHQRHRQQHYRRRQQQQRKGAQKIHRVFDRGIGRRNGSSTGRGSRVGQRGRSGSVRAVAAIMDIEPGLQLIFCLALVLSPGRMRKPGRAPTHAKTLRRSPGGRRRWFRARHRACRGRPSRETSSACAGPANFRRSSMPTTTVNATPGSLILAKRRSPEVLGVDVHFGGAAHHLIADAAIADIGGMHGHRARFAAHKDYRVVGTLAAIQRVQCPRAPVCTNACSSPSISCPCHSPKRIGTWFTATTAASNSLDGSQRDVATPWTRPEPSTTRKANRIDKARRS